MSFQKDKQTRFGVDANYHTITDVKMNFTVLPTPVIEEGEITGMKGGSKSTITLSSYKDKDAYDSKAQALDSKAYEIDFMTAIGVARSTERTCEDAAYFLIKSLDSFWSDAIDVE